MKQMKNNFYSTAMINFAEVITAIKNNLQHKLNNKDEYIFLLEKRNSLDIKLSRMFNNYINSNKIDNENNSKIANKKISICNINDLVNDLKFYYAAYTRFNNICLSVESNLEEVVLSIEEEELYQIIFSLIDTKLRLLMSGDTINIYINIKNNVLTFLISDSGFLLMSDKISEYTKKFNDQRNIFFLDWDEAIRALNKYNYAMSVMNKNMLRIDFPLERVL
jgi:K+-sensing histidine kinase KdpD